MQTTALFPGWIKADWLNGRDTEYGKRLKIIGGELGKRFTVRDIWAWENYGTAYYSIIIWNIMIGYIKIFGKYCRT